MKKFIVSLTVLGFLVLPVSVKAEETICTQYYGGGVVCGVHTPVETGIIDNIPLIASGFIGAGGILAFLTKKFKKEN